MALYKESFTTLRLFVWVFYIGGGLFGLWSTYEHIAQFGFDALWDPVFALVGLVYVVGGLYFVMNAEKLLPKHRVRVIQAVTTLFFIDIAFALVSLVISLSNPASFDPSLAGDPNVWIWIAGGGLVGMLFSFAVYLVIVHAVNTVSGVVRTQSRHLTIAYWIIVLLFLGLMLTLLWVGSFEGM